MVDTDTIIVPYSIPNNASENHLYPSLDGSVRDQLFTDLEFW
jgi:hypothetical protein